MHKKENKKKKKKKNPYDDAMNNWMSAGNSLGKN
jgi:hypothetical protein